MNEGLRLETRTYKMPFGKHRGETLEEIYVEDGSYLDWLVENVDDEILKERIRRTEKEMRNVRICK